MTDWKLDVVMVVPGLPFQGDSIKTKSLGGSETAALHMARELTKLGHYVRVFSQCEKAGEYDGVPYLPISEWLPYCMNTSHDITIIQRMPEAFSNRMASRLNILWCHDLALGRASGQFRGILWNVDQVAVVSKFMADQYKEVYGLPDSVLWQTRNGVDLDLFKPFQHEPRQPKKLVYSARPERGLDRLLRDIFPALLKEDPGLKLTLLGYDNMVDHMREFYQQINQLIAQFGDRIEGPAFATKDQLYRHYATARAYIYPTPGPTSPTFREVSCISAMECMASGLPIVTSRAGALPETIGEGAGILIDGDPDSDAYRTAFIEATLRFVSDESAWLAASEAGRRHAAGLSWAAEAEQWSERFCQLIAARNDNPHRLLYHFMKHSDIMAAKALIQQEATVQTVRAMIPIDGEVHPGVPVVVETAQITDEHLKQIAATIDREWGFTKSPDEIKAQYDRIGETTTDVFAMSAQEPRYHYLKQWLLERPGIEKLIDFGCAHGGYCTNLCNELGRSWVGIDLSEKTLEFAKRWRDERCQTPERVQFLQGDHTIALPALTQADALIMFEVLEHVTDPTVVIDAMERWIKPGGIVLLTVPYGPWEYMSYGNYPWRAHLWEFDMHDLRDLFKGKTGLTITTMPHGWCQELQEPLGWYIIEYRVGNGKTGQINMDRKLALQRPKQTVSASLMAGPNSEETMSWCLPSLAHLVDEIVIADTGMSEPARAIAQQHGARLISGSNPIEHGFETPRNEGLAACRMDWILWVDTDERIMDGDRMHKYIRANLYNGYSIRQHHFACDTTFKPDLPVRLFRREPCEGKTMRFFGCVAGDTMIATPSGDRPIKDLVGTRPWIYAYDTTANQLVVTRPDTIVLTKQQAAVLDVTFDDGSSITVTPEHPFLLRRHYQGTGDYRAAKDLQPGDSVMPLYRWMDDGYAMIRVSQRRYVPEHRFVYEAVHGLIPDEYVVHHCDQNRLNNDPTNLVAMTNEDHIAHHHTGKVLSDATKRLIADHHAPCSGEHNAMFGRTHSDSTKQQIGQASRDRRAGYGNSRRGWFQREQVSALNRKTWNDPVIRAKRIAGIRAAHAKRKALAADNHRVVSVTPAGVTDVYNMEVPSVHNFIANGVVVHNCIHEHPELGLNEGPGQTIILADVHIAHVGYLIESGRRRRFERNYPLLQRDMAKYPDRVLQKHFIMRDNMLLCTYDLQQNGGKVTPEIHQRCRQTIELYRKHFLGLGNYLQTDSVQYYSQALQMLGEGFEMAFQLAASKDVAQLNGVTRVRFASLEEAEKEIGFRVRDAAGQVANPSW